MRKLVTTSDRIVPNLSSFVSSLISNNASIVDIPHSTILRRLREFTPIILQMWCTVSSILYDVILLGGCDCNIMKTQSSSVSVLKLLTSLHLHPLCRSVDLCRSVVLSFYRSVVLSFCCSVGPQKQPSPSAYAGLSPSRRKKKTKHIIAYEETPNGRDGKLAQAFSQNR